MVATLALWAVLTAAQGVTPEALLNIVDLGPPIISPHGRYVAVETRRADLERNTTVIRWTIIELTTPMRIVDAGDGGEPIIERYRGQVTGFSIPQRPQWSADSEWITYQRQLGGRSELWRSRRDGTRQERISNPSQDAVVIAQSEFNRRLEEEGARGYLYDERFSPAHSRTPLFDPAPTPDIPPSPAPGTESLLEDRRVDKTLGVNAPLSIIGCSAPECTGPITGAWTDPHKRSIVFLRWTGARAHGTMALYRWTMGRPRVSQILRTDDLLEDCSLLAERLLCAHESAITPRKLVNVDLNTGRHHTLFDPNSNFRSFEFGAVTPLIWHDAQGVGGFGHLVKPLGYRPGTRYPLVIVQYRSRGFLRGGTGDEYPIHVLSAQGFAVLSFDRPEDPDLEATARSYDELEEKANVNLRDRRRVHSVLLAAIDHLDRLGIIDPDRVGITGLSDGGETVEFALVHDSQRFAAAAASWIPYSPMHYFVIGPKFQPLLTSWRFGFPHGSAAGQWRMASLALNAEQVHTPLLIQVSDQEFLPATEAVAALQHFRRPVEMYVFPNESHLKVQPRHRLNLYRRNVQWFQFWLQDRDASDPLDPQQYDRWRALRVLSQTSAATQAKSGKN